MNERGEKRREINSRMRDVQQWKRHFNVDAYQKIGSLYLIIRF